MSSFDNILRALLIAAAVVNLVSTVHNVLRLRRPDRPDRLAEAVETWVQEAPETNFGAYLLEEYPDGKIRQEEVLQKYENWKKRYKPALPIEVLNDNFMIKAISLGKPETPPDES